MTIPNSVMSIGSYAFEYCYGLARVTLGDGVALIGEYAFYNCTNLFSVMIPCSVTNIGNWAFYGCKRLSEATIGSGGVGRYAFGYCDGLSRVTFGDGVSFIGADAFNYCTNLLSVTVSGSVTNIGNYAFEGCKRLTSVSFLGDEPTCGYSIYGWGLSLVTNYVTQAWTGPTDTWQDRPVRVLSDVSAAIGGVFMAVPGSWILKHQMLFDSMEGDLTSVLESSAANGRMSVAECYVVGLDPQSATNDFKITSFPLKADGTPDLDAILSGIDPPQSKWNVSGARPVIKGAASLDAEFVPVTEGNKANFRFFKVEVVLP